MIGERTIEPPTEADHAQLDEYRAIIEDLLDSDEMVAIYQTVTGKLGILRALLVGHFFKATDTQPLLGMGIVLGDALVLHGGFDWHVVHQGESRTPCLKHREIALVVFPSTMISERMQGNAELDVFELFDDVVDQLPDLKHS